MSLKIFNIFTFISSKITLHLLITFPEMEKQKLEYTVRFSTPETNNVMCS
jgi:hypothetical protein